MSPDWDDIGYVISSKYRLAAIKRLASSPATPTRIAEEASLQPAHVSRALRRLLDRALVALVGSENQHKNRIYELTEKGAKVWAEIRAADLHT